MRITGTIELDGLYVTFNQGTSQQTTLQAGAPASNITLNLPTVADTLAGLAATQTFTNKTINAANNTISNLTVAMLAAGVLNTSTSLTGATDSQVPSALAAKTYADNVSVAGLATKADKTTTISAGTGLTGGGDLSANRTIALADTAVTLGSYGSATQVATFTVDQQGRLTAAGNTSIQIAESQVTNLVTDLAGKQAADVDLDALAALSTTGLIARTGSGTAATRTITAPAAGITISNGDGVSGNPTLALADDLAALEALSGTGIAVRTAANTWAQRSVAAGTGISVTNGDGVSGNPTVAIDSTVVTLTGTQTLTNKTLDNPVIDNAATFVQETTPSNPSAGNYKLYPKSDGSFYVLNSSGVETQIGSGSSSGGGSLNIVDNPSAVSSTTGWTAATNYTVTRDTSNSPLAGVIDTCFAISTTTASSESSTSGVYAPSLAMPAALRNTKTQVSIYANIPATSLGVWRLSVYNASGTRMSLASDSSSVTTLPGGFNGQFVTTFDADSSASYTVSLTQTTRTSANMLYVTNITIGNGITAQGAASGPYESTTSFTIGATTTAPTPGTVTYYRNTYREGEYARIRYEVRQTVAGTAGSGDYLLPIPSGLTIDYTKVTVAAAATGLGDVGHGTLVVNSTQFIATARVLDSGSYADKVHITYYNDTTAATIWGSSGGGFGNTTIVLSIDVRLPIEQWAGNGTVNLGQGAQVEYAFNTDTSTSDNTFAFGYGPAGQNFGSFTSNTTGVTSKRVRFQYPRQETDVLAIEVYSNALGWVSLEDTYLTSNRANTSVYGIDLIPVSGSLTDFDIRFGKAGASPSGGATYAATNGDPWSGYTTWKWRVRKSTASAPVGFGLAGTDGSAGLYKAGQAPGLTTAATIASGYVGQKLDFTSRTVTCTLAGSFYANASALTTLTAGVWLVYGAVEFPVPTATADVSYGFISTNASNDGTGNISPRPAAVYVPAVTSITNTASSSIPVAYMNVSADTPIYAKAFNEDRAGLNVTVSGFAVRIT